MTFQEKILITAVTFGMLFLSCT